MLEGWDDMGKFISLKFLILRRFRIIMYPLIDGNVFTNKIQQECNLFRLLLNDVNKIKYNVHEQFPFFGM